MDSIPLSPDASNKYEQIQAAQKKVGLKALFRGNKTEIWGYECLFCGEFWADYKRKTHTKKCENPNVDPKDKIHSTYRLNVEKNIVEKID